LLKEKSDAKVRSILIRTVRQCPQIYLVFCMLNMKHGS